MALAGLNALAFHFITAATMAEWDSRPQLPLTAKFAGVLGLVLWTNVILAGRLMYYATTWFRQQPRCKLAARVCRDQRDRGRVAGRVRGRRGLSARPADVCAARADAPRGRQRQQRSCRQR